LPRVYAMKMVRELGPRSHSYDQHHHTSRGVPLAPRVNGLEAYNNLAQLGLPAELRSTATMPSPDDGGPT